MKEQIKETIEKEIAPILQGHGGGVEFIDLTDDNVVQVKLTGACSGCMGALMTLKGVVEEQLKAKFPDIKEVEAV